MEKLVSVIVPVYGVEDFIEKNIHSLLSQTYAAIEYLIVDDCSPDGSVGIIQDVLEFYPHRKSSVKIISHEVNKGLPAARNTGLQLSKGDYIFHCDSDDWIETNMISDLIDSLEYSNADIAYCDFYLSFSKRERYMTQPSFEDPDMALGAMLSGNMKFNVWNKIVKSNLYKDNSITFPDGRSMGEDMTIFKLFCHANKIVHLPKAYYHYMQTNPNAFTKRFSPKQLDDIILNTNDLLSYLDEQKGEDYFKLEKDFFKLNMKLPFLITMDKELYGLWRNWFPEANYAIAKNKEFSYRIKLLQYAALNKLDWIVKVYNFIIIKFIYGVIYR